jgi:tetratricopeptide (TPR) repeat protein
MAKARYAEYGAPRVPPFEMDVPALSSAMREAARHRLEPRPARRRALELLAKPAGRRHLWVRHTRRYGRLEIAEALIERAKQQAARDPHSSLLSAQAAREVLAVVVVAPALDPRRQDLWALAMGWQANAYRALNEFQAARLSFLAAWERQEQGSYDVLVEAWLVALEAMLRREEGDAATAVQLVETSYRTFQKFGCGADQLFVGLGLVKCYDANCEVKKAHALLSSLGRLLLAHGPKDPSFVLGMMHEHFVYACETGEGIEARRYLEILEPLYTEPENASFELLARWAMGRLVLREKKWQRAANLLEVVHTTFASQGRDFDAALAGIELALAWSALGKDLAVRKLAQEMEEHCLSERVPAKAQDAFRQFLQAADTCRARQDLLERLLAQLEPVRRNPGRVRTVAA